MATTFTNQAVLSYNGNTVQSNVAVGAVEGVLSIDKQSLSAEYAAGDTMTYIVSIVNNGSAPVTALTLTDDLGAYPFGTGTVQPMDYVAGSVQYYQNGVLQPAPAVDTTTGLVITGVSVPQSGSVIIIYSAALNEFAPLAAESVITNNVGLTGDDVCSVTAAETVTSATGPVLSMMKSVTPVPVAENGALTYTFMLENTGNTALTEADAAIISDTFSPVLNDLQASFNGTPLVSGTDYTYNATTGVFSTAAGVIRIPAASFTQNEITGAWNVVPGTAVLTLTGTVGTICDLTP